MAGQTVNRFALAMTQKLCFFANSAACVETDPEMRRVALAFQNASYDFKTLVRELFASPLVTAWATTDTFTANGVTISVARRDQLCAALSNRLGEGGPVRDRDADADRRDDGDEPARGRDPGGRLQPRLAVAGDVARSEPVLPRGERARVRGGRRQGRRRDHRDDLHERELRDGDRGHGAEGDGLPPSDRHYAAAVQALTDHYNAAIAAKATATSALRSTFAAACQSPTSLSLGL